MDKQSAMADSVLGSGIRQDPHYLDEEDDWVTDFDDESEDLDRFDLGVYAGALK